MVYSARRFFVCLPCAILFLCFSVLLALRLPRLGKRELILVLFVCLNDLCLFGFVGFLFLLMSGKGCGLCLWHSLDFSLTFFVVYSTRRFALNLTALRLPRLGKRELILVLFIRFFDLCLFGFVGFLFLLVSGVRGAVCNCGIPWTFSLTLFCNYGTRWTFSYLFGNKDHTKEFVNKALPAVVQILVFIYSGIQ